MIDHSGIIHKFGNEYLAAMCIAKKSKKLWELGEGTHRLGDYKHPTKGLRTQKRTEKTKGIRAKIRTSR